MGKYCIVPFCQSTSIKTPNKIFISLPYEKTRRLQWQKAMRRKVLLSEKSRKFVCEDHFDLAKDAGNYLYYKTMKAINESVYLQIKPGVIPHKFDCQEREMNKKLPIREPILKRQQQSALADVRSEKKICFEEVILSPNNENSQSVLLKQEQQPMFSEEEEKSDSEEDIPIPPPDNKSEKSTQCNLIEKTTIYIQPTKSNNEQINVCIFFKW